ncbi:MAG: AAA family ATPase [Fibromonadaceae bacterium]|jgi:exonuclease SbcC|nr:AAA family ATPase [Fibromonadaceae bacterium]
MKINKVELKNYRIHKEYEESFGNGINLLLGSNGSGKSSVLEAIGFALFDSSVRSKDKDIVTEGEKSGSAKVFFTGTDEKEYEIERKFGSNPSVKLSSLDSSRKWERNSEVYKQVGKILDIDNINGVFFESVICAKQNQFIDIFTKNDEPRAKHFNELFDTAIYNDLWKKLGEQNERKYEEEKIKKEERRKTLAERQRNIAELEKDLEIKQKELSEEAKNKEILENELKAKNAELDKYKKFKEQINSKKNELKNSEINIERLSKIKELDKNALEKSAIAKKFLEENKEKFEKYVSAKKRSGVLENAFWQFKNIDKIYIDLQKQLQELEKKQILGSGTCPILKIPCQKLTEDNKNEEIIVKLQELKTKIEKIEQDKKQAEELKNEIEKIKTEFLMPMQNIYDKCLQNKRTAEDYEALKKRLVESEKIIQEEMEKREKSNKELNELRTIFSEEQLNLLEEALKKITNTHIEAVQKTANLIKDIEQKNREIEDYKKTEAEISKLGSELAIIQQKLTLTKIFRAQIKDLGRIVAEERVQRIANTASDYFNKITNRPESILWVCSESEKYSLYLDNGENKCSFINLSGGEQISVAIAIRLALSQDFGNSGLIILDEPTNNLDKDKRQLLAENLPRMVENLNQLFVVTHDDMFRDTATKVIEFGSE